MENYSQQESSVKINGSYGYNSWVNTGLALSKGKGTAFLDGELAKGTISSLEHAQYTAVLDKMFYAIGGSLKAIEIVVAVASGDRNTTYKSIAEACAFVVGAALRGPLAGSIASMVTGWAYDYVVNDINDVKIAYDELVSAGSAVYNSLMEKYDIIRGSDGYASFNKPADMFTNGNTINFDLSYAGSIWGDTNNRLFGDALGYADGQLNGEGGKVQIMLTDMNLADGMDGLLKARADIMIYAINEGIRNDKI